jgi:large subunit ribosomal protein L13
MKTSFAKPTEVNKKWYVVDASDMVVGRLASRVASVLRGKTKSIYTPHVDTGDYVIVINAEKARFTGNKLNTKIYYHHSGYPGGIKKKSARELMKESPEKIIISAVRGMLPKNKLGRRQLKKLKVYRGSEHPHMAQKLEVLNLNKGV